MTEINGANSQARKDTPLFSGLLKYFPDALCEVARLSKFGNDKHNPGQPLHWSKGKSSDHDDCVARHLLDAGTRDPESGNHRHRTMVAWRALAALQTEIENEAEANTTEKLKERYRFYVATATYCGKDRRHGSADRRTDGETTQLYLNSPQDNRSQLRGGGRRDDDR